MAEIRVRNVPKDLIDILKKMEVRFKVKETTSLIRKMIEQYEDDQKSIRELQSRNSQLHSTINKYHYKEASSKQMIEAFIVTTGNMVRSAKQLNTAAKRQVKQFSGTNAKRRK